MADLEERMYSLLRALAIAEKSAYSSEIKELVREYEAQVGPKVVLYLEGGVLQDVQISNAEIEVMLVDYDVEGLSDGTTLVEQESGEEDLAVVSIPYTTVNAVHVGSRFRRFRETDGIRC